MYVELCVMTVVEYNCKLYRLNSRFWKFLRVNLACIQFRGFSIARFQNYSDLITTASAPVEPIKNLDDENDLKSVFRCLGFNIFD